MSTSDPDESSSAAAPAAPAPDVGDSKDDTDEDVKAYETVFVRWSFNGGVQPDTNLFMCKGVESAYDALTQSYDVDKWEERRPTLFFYDFSDITFCKLAPRNENDSLKELEENEQEDMMTKEALSMKCGGWTAKYHTQLPIQEYVFIQNTQTLKEFARSRMLPSDQARALVDEYILDKIEQLTKDVTKWKKLIDEHVAKKMKTLEVNTGPYEKDHFLNALDTYKELKRNAVLIKQLNGGFDVKLAQEKRDITSALKWFIPSNRKKFKYFADLLWETCRNVRLLSAYSSVLQNKDAEPLKFFEYLVSTDPQIEVIGYEIFQDTPKGFPRTFLKPTFPQLRF